MWCVCCATKERCEDATGSISFHVAFSITSPSFLNCQHVRSRREAFSFKTPLESYLPLSPLFVVCGSEILCFHGNCLLNTPNKMTSEILAHLHPLKETQTCEISSIYSVWQLPIQMTLRCPLARDVFNSALGPSGGPKHPKLFVLRSCYVCRFVCFVPLFASDRRKTAHFTLAFWSKTYETLFICFDVCQVKCYLLNY